MARSTAGWFAIWLIVLAIGCKPKPVSVPAIQMLNGRTMGTTYSVKLVPSPSMPDLIEISRTIQAELDSVNDQMSSYLETSELSRFNQQQTTDWFTVSTETAQVVQLARTVSDKSEGGFDVTIGPLVRLWGFGPDGRPETIPTDEDVKHAIKHVGYLQLDVRTAPPALRKSQQSLEVDLSAIAKGHAVDRIAQVLVDLGISDYLVEIGGEVSARGTKIDGQPWQLGIEKPIEMNRTIELVIGLTNQCLATSGDYRNFYEHEGKRYSHTIVPATGYPSQDEIASASVVADSCALADAIATSMMAVGFEKGLELAEQNNWAVLLMARRGEVLTSAVSSRFAVLFPGVGVDKPTEPTEEESIE